MQFVIISGMSGAGKSRAASDLEDLGFYCVDNMPAEMIRSLLSCVWQRRDDMKGRARNGYPREHDV